MVHVLVKIKEDIDSFMVIEEFNNNIFNKQISNIMFKEDSFIRFINPNMVLIYLNTMIPKELPFYIMILSFTIGIIFKISVLVGFASILTVIYLVFNDIIYHVFKWGLRKKGYKGQIEVI